MPHTFVTPSFPGCRFCGESCSSLCPQLVAWPEAGPPNTVWGPACRVHSPRSGRKLTRQPETGGQGGAGTREGRLGMSAVSGHRASGLGPRVGLLWGEVDVEGPNLSRSRSCAGAEGGWDRSDGEALGSPGAWGAASIPRWAGLTVTRSGSSVPVVSSRPQCGAPSAEGWGGRNQAAGAIPLAASRGRCWCAHFSDAATGGRFPRRPASGFGKRSCWGTRPGGQRKSVWGYSLGSRPSRAEGARLSGVRSQPSSPDAGAGQAGTPPAALLGRFL